MLKEKRILIYFIGWLILGFCIMFIGVNNVFAATYNMNYEYLQKYYDNSGSTVTAVTTNWNESLQSYVSNNITTIANSYGAGLSITSPIPLIANHTYTLSFYFEGISNIAKSSKNNIAISTSLTGAATNYANNNFYVDMIQTSVSNNSIIQFVFTTKGGGNYIFFPWTTTSNSTHSYVLTQISMEDLGSEGISQQDINNSLNNQTNELNNSIQNSTNEIKGEINNMEQNIIDSNKETQDVIKDQFNDCKNYDYTLSSGNDLYSSNIGFLNETGSITGYTSWRYTDYISINNNKSYNITLNYDGNGSAYCLYNQDKSLIGCYLYNNERDINVSNNNAYYIRFSYYANTNYPNNKTTFTGKFCSNKIDETNDKLDNLQGALTDSSLPNTSGLENSAGWLPAGPLDSVLNLPLSLFNALTTNLNKSCNPINIPLPYVNKNITLPCINTLYNQIGITSFLSWIGVIVSGLMLYTYLLKLYKWIEDRISLNETHNVDSWGGL